MGDEKEVPRAPIGACRCRRSAWRLAAVLLVATVWGPALQGAEPLPKPVVTVSTTLMAAAVRAVAGDRVNVNSLLPPRMCPGHFDLSARQAGAAESSALFLAHGFEPFLAALAGRMADRHAVLDVGGNAMVPSCHLVLVGRVKDALIPLLPAAAAELEANAAAYARRVQAASDALRPTLAPLAGRPVFAAVQNAEVLTWMGFDVVATFPRDEGASARTISRLLELGRTQHVVLVADNLQSAGKLGAQLADDLKCRFVMLSNFPEDGTPEGYLAALQDLCRRVAEALAAP